MTDLFIILLFGLFMATSFTLIKIGGLFLQKGFKKEVANELDYTHLIIEWLFWIFCFSVFMYFFKGQHQIHKGVLIVIGILFGSILISFGFIVTPLLILLQKRKYTIAIEYQNWARATINDRIQIRIIQQAQPNAYATGIFSSNKVILLSEALINNLNEADIKNIIFHEYAHLKNNHLFILYLSNVLCCSISVLSSSYFYPLFESTSYPGLLVALHGALYGVLFIIIPGLVQRQLEFNADKYAAIAVGGTIYGKSLINLNTITNKGLEKKVIHYPHLNDRLKHVSNY